MFVIDFLVYTRRDKFISFLQSEPSDNLDEILLLIPRKMNDD